MFTHPWTLKKGRWNGHAVLYKPYINRQFSRQCIFKVIHEQISWFFLRFHRVEYFTKAEKGRQYVLITHCLPFSISYSIYFSFYCMISCYFRNNRKNMVSPLVLDVLISAPYNIPFPVCHSHTDMTVFCIPLTLW